MSLWAAFLIVYLLCFFMWEQSDWLLPVAPEYCSTGRCQCISTRIYPWPSMSCLSLWLLTASDNATVYKASKLSDMVGLRVRDAHLSTGQSWAASLFQVRPSKNLTVVRKTQYPLPQEGISDFESSVTFERLWVKVLTCAPSLCFLELLSRTGSILLTQCQMTAPFLLPWSETGLGQRLLSLHSIRVVQHMNTNCHGARYMA